LSVSFFNAGPGPALDIKVRGTTLTGGVVDERTVDALAPGGQFGLAFVVRPADEMNDVSTVDQFTLEGDCTDRAGKTRYPIRYTYSQVPSELASEGYVRNLVAD
jgi:hypothetical protein